MVDKSASNSDFAHECERQSATIAIIVVTWNGRSVIDDCCRSVLAECCSDMRQNLIVIDNGSTDGTPEHVAATYPEVDLVRLPENVGFCAGNNAGWLRVKERLPDAEFVVLLNHDTIVEAHWLKPLIESLRAEPRLAAVQPKLLLHPHVNRINSAGNRSHYLGFGFTIGLEELDDGRFDSAHEIDFPSGAAVMLRASALREFDLFEPEMFTYLEDSDLGWKLRQAGRSIGYVPTSRVYHKYRHKTGWEHYECLERNRWWLLLVYYRKRTLLLLLPAIILMEIAQLSFASLNGVSRAKLRAWAWFLHQSHRRRIAELRARSARRRRQSDREFMGAYSSTIDSAALRSPTARLIVNTVFRAYFEVVKWLIRW
jgi:GT2 family glycosyltransferase